MNRRTFIAGGLVAAPLACRAQPKSTRPHRIGLLSAETADYESRRLDLLKATLRELGYVEGSDFIVEARFAGGKYDRLRALADELVSARVDLIVASGSKAGFAAKSATSTIPIVVSNMGDAIAAGFIASYAEPGGNVTGMSALGPESFAKQLELLHQVKPGLTTIGVLFNPANPNAASALRELAREGALLRIAVEPIEVRGHDDIAAAFAIISQNRIGAILVVSDTLFSAHAKTIADHARKHRIASAGTFDYAQAGGLIGYSSNRTEGWRELATYVDRILKGASPRSLAVEQPRKIVLVLNLRTAEVLGLAIPQSVLLRADHVIR